MLHDLQFRKITSKLGDILQDKYKLIVNPVRIPTFGIHALQLITIN